MPVLHVDMFYGAFGLLHSTQHSLHYDVPEVQYLPLQS